MNLRYWIYDLRYAKRSHAKGAEDAKGRRGEGGSANADLIGARDRRRLKQGGLEFNGGGMLWGRAVPTPIIMKVGTDKCIELHEPVRYGDVDHGQTVVNAIALSRYGAKAIKSTSLLHVQIAVPFTTG